MPDNRTGKRTDYEGPRLPPERAWLMVGYQGVIDLARSRLPLTISPDGHSSPQEDWRVIAPAFLARIARTAEALSALVPIGARLDAMNLARNLLEHVAWMAWIAADPDTRFDVWLKQDYSARLDYDKALRKRLESKEGTRWPEKPIPDEDRAAYKRHVRAVKRDLPGLPTICREADDHWLPRYPAGLSNHRAVSLVDQYVYIYDPYSWASHPRLLGLQAFWDFKPQWTVVHAEEVPGSTHDPLHMGQLLAGHGLLLAAMATGTPPVTDAVELINFNAELALQVRTGALTTVEVAPGVVRLVAASEGDLPQSGH